MSNKFLRATLVAAVLGAAPALAADISGAGATFPYPIYAKWADAYKTQTGNGLNYQSIGSGGGIKQIIANTVTFGASDKPLKVEELEKNGLVQWPQVMGGIVPIINIEGVGNEQLVLDGPALAKIFLGEIKTWNDPAIASLNPTLKLSDTPIAVVHRSDGSGTTFNFTDYLAKVSADWKSKVGSDSAVEWPVGLAAKGNEGVANTVANTKGSIGYVEYAYAKQNKIPFADLVNKEGAKVSPTVESFQAAAANADWENAPGYYQILTNQPGAKSWPITAATFILVHKQPKDPAAVGEALKFFNWAFKNGAKDAEALDYIPMPDNVIGMIRTTWATEIKGVDGKLVFKGD
ncbi:phosphate transport system substrate-binding protein [Rhodoblastus acidophilus]|uniref:phosphate ABC transporter substrate-binding protein PstS n=1 Tax=Rhodoblastus acidophilus TaxID=1074 RepID=UPI002223F18F|nr:phosphate ABC transporter substrate-binding protein PstS [Rhodoblastus acidophilus]MCW2286207.1 phosphate transport system substrate-binding protein [Rhodoblastus acidophilus]MCW2335111.1 phosphate transport system substrate-binding protein [Rhodoblastus acidophilus]